MYFSSYSGGQMKFNRNNVSFNFSGYTKNIKKMQYTIEKRYKMVTRNAAFKKKFQCLLGFKGKFWKISVLEKWVWQA